MMANNMNSKLSVSSANYGLNTFDNQRHTVPSVYLKDQIEKEKKYNNFGKKNDSIPHIELPTYLPLN